ncbi:hypothetical protein [Streptomyces sp. B6B3]|uniref:hypothetical protein n=1 Tax=Streptomyces sp. B6B3 TaxID=3153570 RepID=UPI00325D02C9
MERAAAPLFFTSYATKAEDRGQVQRFHVDVQAEVHALLGRHPGTDGLLKDPIPRQGPESAVLDCRVLLALYSESYLRATDSARDWAVFRERVERVLRRTGQSPQALIGVVWRAEALVLPRSVARAGPLLSGWGDVGGTVGVADLLADPAGLDGYRRLVRQVAERLVDAAARQVPAISAADAAAVPPRFGPRRGEQADRRRAATAPERDPRAASDPRASGEPGGSRDSRDAPEARPITLLCLTGTRDRMVGLRASADGYGPSPEDWRPFLPQADEPAVAIVRRALAAYGLRNMTARQLPARPETGPAPARPARSAVLLVDPWLASSLSAETLRTELAGWSSAIGAVVVVLARGDAETTRHTAELRAAVLARIINSGLQAPHHEAGSAQGLAHTVIGAVADMLALGPGAPAEPLDPAEPLASTTPRQDAAPRPATPDPGRRAAPDQAADRTASGRASRVETSAERLTRRRRERSSWLSPVAGLLPPLLYGTSGGKQAET